MKAFMKRYGVIGSALLLAFVILTLVLWYEVPEGHKDRNLKIFFKWSQVVLFSILLAEKLTIIYQRFIRPRLHENSSVEGRVKP